MAGNELIAFRIVLKPKGAPPDIRPALRATRKMFLKDMANRMRAKAPQGIKGDIRVTQASVRIDHRAAMFVEHGMQPLGDRPVSPAGLGPWVASIGKDPRAAFAIAWAIGRRGIPARPFIAPAIKGALKNVRSHFGKAWEVHFK